jgi:hypothetical protein
MRHSIMPRVILLGVALAWAGSASAWTRQENFDNGTAGGTIRSTGIEWLKLSRYASTGYSGLGGEIAINGGTSGSSDFGAYIYFPEPVREGGEVWYRVRTYMPTSFDYQSPNFALKFLRIRTATGGTGRGYLDTYINRNGTYMHQNEFYRNQSNEDWNEQDRTALRSSEVVQKGVWETFEVYVRFSSQAGQGIYRVWKNGKLTYENTKWPTLATSSDVADMALLFTYWNGNAPKSQSMYVDDIIVTTDRPSNRDSHGNAFIGVGGSTRVPLAPVLTEVE